MLRETPAEAEELLGCRERRVEDDDSGAVGSGRVVEIEDHEGLAVVGGDGVARGFRGRRRGRGQPLEIRPHDLAQAVPRQSRDTDEAGRDLEAGESGAGEGAEVVVAGIRAVTAGR